MKDATPGRARDSAWENVGPFPRNAEIDERILVAATKEVGKLGNVAELQVLYYQSRRDRLVEQSEIQILAAHGRAEFLPLLSTYITGRPAF